LLAVIAGYALAALFSGLSLQSFLVLTQRAPAWCDGVLC
jgi:hypothetical protein